MPCSTYHVTRSTPVTLAFGLSCTISIPELYKKASFCDDGSRLAELTDHFLCMSGSHMKAKHALGRLHLVPAVFPACSSIPCSCLTLSKPADDTLLISSMHRWDFPNSMLHLCKPCERVGKLREAAAYWKTSQVVLPDDHLQVHRYMHRIISPPYAIQLPAAMLFEVVTLQQADSWDV